MRQQVRDLQASSFFVDLPSKMKPRPVPEYAELMTLAEFEAACRRGSFVDSDGHGYYVQDGMMLGSATPSIIRNGVVDREATHVAWFNK